jgi:threonine aldolase
MGVIGLPGASGRIDPAALNEALAAPDHPHVQAPAALSLTNATEYGAVYSAAAMGALIAPARAAGLKIHIDGARLANAVAAGFDPKALARLGADSVVVGGTKAGSTPTEAIVLIDRSLGRRLGARLKHAGQLVSKSRFLAAPWIAMLEDGAWVRRAAHANAMAKRLAAGCPFKVVHAVEANGVFLEMDEAAYARLRGAGWFAWRVLDGSVRLMCSWATTAEAVDELKEALKNAK